MVDFTSGFIVAVAEQLSFVCAFLGGISAAMLITVVVFIAEKKSIGWIVSSAALAACSFLVAVVASWRIIIVLHPESPIEVSDRIVGVLYPVMLMGYGVGFFSLLLSIGLSGWLRSRRAGLITTSIAIVSLLFFVLVTPFGL